MRLRDAVYDIGEFPDVPTVDLSVEEGGDTRFRLDDVRDLACCRTARELKRNLCVHRPIDFVRSAHLRGFPLYGVASSVHEDTHQARVIYHALDSIGADELRTRFWVDDGDLAIRGDIDSVAVKVFDEGIWGGCLFIDECADERAIAIRAGCELYKPDGDVACVISLGCFEGSFELADGGEGFPCGVGESGFGEELLGLVGFA